MSATLASKTLVTFVRSRASVFFSFSSPSICALLPYKTRSHPESLTPSYLTLAVCIVLATLCYREMLLYCFQTCYCNSVLQALYFCEPFRKAVLDYASARRAAAREKAPAEYAKQSAGFLSAASGASVAVNGSIKNAVKGVVGIGAGSANQSDAAPRGESSTDPATSTSAPIALPGEETMLTALADLFAQIIAQKKRTGSVPPKSFVTKLRQENELFSSYMHQDAHEFLNFILNDIVECLRREAAERLRRKRAAVVKDGTSQVNGVRPVKRINSGSDAGHPNGMANGGTKLHAHEEQSEEADPSLAPTTFVHDLFEGQLSNEVRCLCCETVTRRVESFFDLSVDVEQNSSLTSCLRNFSSTELLEKQDKFFCDACCSLQEAERRMRIKRLPQILSLHLKRFKYVEQFGKYKKLQYRVVFPLELRLCNTSDDAEDPDRLYALFAVVVHVGSGPNQGHYVSLIKSHGQWLMFDDDCVEPKDESELQTVFGITQESSQSTEAGYILFYEQVIQ